MGHASPNVYNAVPGRNFSETRNARDIQDSLVLLKLLVYCDPRIGSSSNDRRPRKIRGRTRLKALRDHCFILCNLITLIGAA